MSDMAAEKYGSIATVIPPLREGQGVSGRGLGIQRMIQVRLGDSLLVDSVTYKDLVFIAPCDGCRVEEIWLAAAVPISAGTNTLAINNHDASGDTDKNLLSATTINPATLTALEGLKLTLSTTDVNRDMDEGDTIRVTLVCGTMTTDGEGYLVSVIVNVPEINVD